VPQARLDDVMVSYATPAAASGRIVDSYDVFLIREAGGAAGASGGRASFVARAGDLLYFAAGVPPRRRRARALLHLLDRLSRAARRGARRGVPRLAARARAADAAYRDPRLPAGARAAQIPDEMSRSPRACSGASAGPCGGRLLPRPIT